MPLPGPDAVLLLILLVLLAIANGAPILAHKILGARWDYPLDGGRKLADGHALFGQSKTLRGVVAGVLVTPIAAMVLGLDAVTGVLIGTFAMLGDVTSSFIKRRLARPPSSQALLIDQIPESLFPLLAVAPRLALTAGDIMLLVPAFIVLELGLSRLLFRFNLRERPY